jgi:hypothetical protein
MFCEWLKICLHDMLKKTLKNNPQSYSVSAVPKGWMAVGFLSWTAPSGIPGDLSEVIVALPSMGALLGGPIIPPHSWDQKWILQE